MAAPLIGGAATWLAARDPHQIPEPIIPELRKLFSLTASEACQAIKQANLIRVESEKELTRLEQQRDGAADRLDALLEAREAAMEGSGQAPSALSIQQARAALETAEGLLARFCRTGGAA